MPKFHLILLIHSHQPVGNFDDVLETTYQVSYLPFVDALSRHPGVRLGLHYSGPLLEWLVQHHPEFCDQLRALVGRGQVEMVGGGFFEPILVSIPPEDQAEQLNHMRDYLHEHFGATPAGAWLAERVWEPQLPYVLSLCDVRYTLVDDSHFLAAGFEPEQLYGDFIAEDRGRTVRVFPGLQRLRYLVPFGTVEDTLGFLRGCASAHSGGMAAMGDDCEKFGAWPGTYDHCYRDGWVEKFFAALEAAKDWLVTTPPGDYVGAHAPQGRADLPTASYSEMMEWALPTASRDQFHAVNHEFANRPDVLRFLRGGQWRGFFAKYAESNLLNKKMLHVSEALRKLASRRLTVEKQAKLTRARLHLLRSQCNDAYWHGIFGGVYAPHLRTELWRELVRAETLAEETTPSSPRLFRVRRLDFDADGLEEVYVTSRRMAALVAPAEGGTLSALDFRPTGVTLINSMQRRLESYHRRLKEASQASPSQVASIHDQVHVKEPGLERMLRYDRWPRHCFRLLLFSTHKTFEDYQEVKLDEHAILAGGAYTVREARPGQITLTCDAPFSHAPGGDPNRLLHCTKELSFTHTERGYRVMCATDLASAGVDASGMQIGIELVLNMLAPDAPDRYIETPDGRHPLRWSAALQPPVSPAAPLRMVDEWQNVAVNVDAPGAAGLWVSAIETVSESEGGFERVYQGSQIMAVWPAELAPGSVWRGTVSLDVAPALPERPRKS